MDMEKSMDEIQSLRLKIDCMAEKLSSLDEKFNKVTESQQIIIHLLAVCIMYI